MDDVNQPVHKPEVNSQMPSVNNTHGSKIVPIGLGILFVLVVVGSYLLGARNSQTVVSNQQSSVVPTIIPSPTPIDETANWKTYTNTRSNYPYTFSYPSDWELGESEYENLASLTHKKGAIAITFSDDQYPYGFGGLEAGDFETQSLKITIAGKEYATKETIISNQKAYVDFSTSAPNKIHILFGTGYPAAQDNIASLVEYNNAKNTILQILSTFQFTSL
ncbi:hypothetical protein HYT32_00455 [Candidatus Roizmanbacteria bacterium]|nr:hypothetical protein [Candidatus Roizmanbacteria bacterium]